jgi:citrate lyase subunit beta/citryl-CoA lyase
MRSLLLLSGIADVAAAHVALASNVDCIVIDLMALDGQAGAEGHRITAEMLRDAKARPTRPKLFVRMPPLDHAGAISLLDAMIGAGAEGIVLPGALGGHDVTRLDARISVEEAVHAIDHGSVKIIAEAASTARGVHGLASFRGASHRLSGLIWSPERLAGDLGGMGAWTSAGALRAPLAYAGAQVVIAAYAAGVTAIFDAGTDDVALRSERYVAAQADGFKAEMKRAIGEFAEIEPVM